MTEENILKLLKSSVKEDLLVGFMLMTNNLEMAYKLTRKEGEGYSSKKVIDTEYNGRFNIKLSGNVFIHVNSGHIFFYNYPFTFVKYQDI